MSLVMNSFSPCNASNGNYLPSPAYAVEEGRNAVYRPSSPVNSNYSPSSPSFDAAPPAGSSPHSHSYYDAEEGEDAYYGPSPSMPAPHYVPAGYEDAFAPFVAGMQSAFETFVPHATRASKARFCKEVFYSFFKDSVSVCIDGYVYTQFATVPFIEDAIGKWLQRDIGDMEDIRRMLFNMVGTDVCSEERKNAIQNHFGKFGFGFRSQ